MNLLKHAKQKTQTIFVITVLRRWISGVTSSAVPRSIRTDRTSAWSKWSSGATHFDDMAATQLTPGHVSQQRVGETADRLSLLPVWV